MTISYRGATGPHVPSSNLASQPENQRTSDVPGKMPENGRKAAFAQQIFRYCAWANRGTKRLHLGHPSRKRLDHRVVQTFGFASDRQLFPPVLRFFQSLITVFRAALPIRQPVQSASKCRELFVASAQLACAVVSMVPCGSAVMPGTAK